MSFIVICFFEIIILVIVKKVIKKKFCNYEVSLKKYVILKLNKIYFRRNVIRSEI